MYINKSHEAPRIKKGTKEERRRKEKRNEEREKEMGEFLLDLFSHSLYSINVHCCSRTIRNQCTDLSKIESFDFLGKFAMKKDPNL